MRKSLMSALIGIHVEQGNLDLSKTLEELGIDRLEPSLSPEEKQASVGDLIKARSGIYIPALGESAHMSATRPKRHSHPPGTFWYYNNWDFNALGTIFQQETKTDIFKEFENRFAIARRLCKLDIPADESRQNSRLRPRTIRAARATQKLLYIRSDLAGKRSPRVEHAE